LQIRVHRFDSGTRLHNILCISPKKRHLKQDTVRKFLYTICTQNIGVDLAISAPQSSLKEILSKQ